MRLGCRLATISEQRAAFEPPRWGWLEQGVATYVWDHVMAVPSQISLHVRDRGAHLEATRSETRIVRLGRTVVGTDGEIRDASDADRLIAHGWIAWSVTGEAPQRAAPSSGLPAQPPVEPAGIDFVQAAGITSLRRGGEFDLSPDRGPIGGHNPVWWLAPCRSASVLRYGVTRGLAPGAAVGSCATEHREPSQGLTAAALSGSLRVPQIA